LVDAQEHHRKEWKQTLPRIVEATEEPLTEADKVKQIISQDEGWS
jgi:hypothetical protein